METADISPTLQSSHIEITDEDNSHRFLLTKVTVHYEFIPKCETVNHAYYVEILKRLREAV
jgi:acyl-CoA thioesterase FadM